MPCYYHSQTHPAECTFVYVQLVQFPVENTVHIIPKVNPDWGQRLMCILHSSLMQTHHNTGSLSTEYKIKRNNARTGIIINRNYRYDMKDNYSGIIHTLRYSLVKKP